MGEDINKYFPKKKIYEENPKQKHFNKIKEKRKWRFRRKRRK